MKKILVATDYSACSNKALYYSMRLAQESGAEVVVFSGFFLAPTPSVNSPSTLYIQDTLSHKQEMVESSLKEMVAEYQTWEYFEKPSESLKISVIARNGLPEVSIAEIANEQHADLIVMGAKGSTALTEILFGSVTKRVLAENIPCPVLAVPIETVYQSPKNLVFSSNFHISDSPAIDWLLAFGKVFGSHLTLLNISSYEDDPIADNSALKEKYFFTAESVMSYEQFRSDNVVKGLHEHLEKHQTHIVGMYKKEKSFIDWLANGSFTDRMLFNTHVPILIYK